MLFRSHGPTQPLAWTAPTDAPCPPPTLSCAVLPLPLPPDANLTPWHICPLLRIKPKPPGAKTGSHRFPDVTGGMDSGFSSCAAPAFCHGPGISKIGRYMRVLRVAGKLQGRRMRREGFRRRMKMNIGVARVKQFPEAEVLRGRKLKSHADGE